MQPCAADTCVTVNATMPDPVPTVPSEIYILFVGYTGNIGPFNYWHYVVVNSSKSIVTNARVREVLLELTSFGTPTTVQGGDPDGFIAYGGDIWDQMGWAGGGDLLSWGLQSWQVQTSDGIWVDAGPTMFQIISYQNGQLLQAYPIQVDNPTPFTNPVPYGPQGASSSGRSP